MFINIAGFDTLNFSIINAGDSKMGSMISHISGGAKVV